MNVCCLFPGKDHRKVGEETSRRQCSRSVDPSVGAAQPGAKPEHAHTRPRLHRKALLLISVAHHRCPRRFERETPAATPPSKWGGHHNSLMRHGGTMGPCADPLHGDPPTHNESFRDQYGGVLVRQPACVRADRDNVASEVDCSSHPRHPMSAQDSVTTTTLLQKNSSKTLPARFPGVTLGTAESCRTTNRHPPYPQEAMDMPFGSARSPVPINLGNAARSPSMRMRLISTNCRASRAFPFRVVIAADRTTCARRTPQSSPSAQGGWGANLGDPIPSPRQEKSLRHGDTRSLDGSVPWARYPRSSRCRSKCRFTYRFGKAPRINEGGCFVLLSGSGIHSSASWSGLRPALSGFEVSAS